MVAPCLGMRSSGTPPSARRFLRPDTRVYPVPGVSISRVRRLPRSEFVSPFSADERDALVALYSLGSEVRPYDGRAVRLDSAQLRSDGQVEVVISEVGFFDFLSTNLTILPPSTPAKSWSRLIAGFRRRWRARHLLDRLATTVRSFGTPRCSADILRIVSLANIVAVSLLVEDAGGKIGIVCRSRHVSVSSGMFGSTVTGTLDSEDFRARDPFVHCALREAAEELGLHGLNPRFDGIVISKQKLQPVFLYSARVDQRWSDLGATIARAQDFDLESSAVFAVPLEDAIRFAAHSKMTDTSAYQIWNYALRQGCRGGRSVLRFLPMNRQKYLFRLRQRVV